MWSYAKIQSLVVLTAEPLSIEQERRDFSNRLVGVLRKAGEPEWGSAKRLAELTGKSNSAAQKWLNGEAIPGRESLRKIASEFGTSLEWLEYGDYEKRLFDCLEHSGKALRNIRNHYVHGLKPQSEAIVAEEDYWEMAFSVHFFAMLELNPNACKFYTVREQNMHPTLYIQDTIVVDTSKQEFQDRGIFVFETGSGKRIHRVSENIDGSITLVSDNPDPKYPDERIGHNDIVKLDIIGEVKWSGGART